MNTTAVPNLIKHFDVVEYAAFSIMLGVSLIIGLYFGIYKGGQITVSEYIFGNKEMSLLPVSMSLISSQISGITLLGIPTEIYTYGTQYAAIILTNILVAIITLIFYLPVFYKVQLLSPFEYLELRFNRSVRLFTSILYVISTILFIPIVVYGPALVLNQVSGMNIYVVSSVISFVCIVYTTLGGIKAVVWTDTIQGAIMIVATFTVVVLGIIKAGGFSLIFQKASEGDRLEMFNFDPDPTARISFLSVVIGQMFFLASYVPVNPSFIQRFISLPTYKQAQKSVYILLFGIQLMAVPSIFLGLIMYATYNNCDPLSAKIISRPDQILPYFVMDVAGHIKGLPGLFIVGIFSAAMSTMSTGLNTVSGTLYEDFIQPWFPEISDKAASSIIKSIVVVIGAISVAIVFLIDNIGAIIEVCTKFSGVTNGTMLGLFTLGILFPSANGLGALVGGISSFLLMLWIMVGNLIATSKGFIKYPQKPISIEGCLVNVTQMLNSGEPTDEDIWPIYKISMFYYAMVGCLAALLVGLIVTYLTGPQKPESINTDLYSALVYRKKDKKILTPVALDDSIL